MKKCRFLVPLTVFLLITMVFSACSSSNSSKEYYRDADSAAYAEESYSYEDVSSNDGSGKVYTNESAVKERMLVYDVDYDVESTTYEESRKNLENKAVELGGYMSSFNSRSGSYESVSYVFRIPTNNLTAFTDAIEAQGNVTHKSTSVKDYTNIYYDYSTEIDLLKTEEEYIKTYLDEATESFERSNLIDQLLSIRREIARLEREKNNITDVVMYSTVTVDLTNVASYSDITVDYGDSLRDAFFKGWEGFADVMKGLLYVIILLSPLIVIAVIIAVVVIVVVRIVVGKNKKKKKAAMAVPPQAVGVVPPPQRPVVPAPPAKPEGKE